MFHSGCHSTLIVSIATRYEADAYCPNEPPIPKMDSIRVETIFDNFDNLTQTHKL